MSTTDDLKAKALAIAEIFPGPWGWNEQGWLCGPDPKGDPDFGTIIVDSPEYSTGTVADYLAAVDPGTILALIEERDDARREACEVTAIAQDGDDHADNLRRVAANYGWSGLYPDDDEPA